MSCSHAQRHDLGPVPFSLHPAAVATFVNYLLFLLCMLLVPPWATLLLTYVLDVPCLSPCLMSCGAANVQVAVLQAGHVGPGFLCYSMCAICAELNSPHVVNTGRVLPTSTPPPRTIAP